MKWMNFLPLLIWATSMLWLCEWVEKNRRADKNSEPDDKERDAFAQIYVGGVLFWIVLGALCALCG